MDLACTLFFVQDTFHSGSHYTFVGEQPEGFAKEVRSRHFVVVIDPMEDTQITLYVFQMFFDPANLSDTL